MALDLAVIRETLAAAVQGTGLSAYDYPPAVPAVGEAGTMVLDEPEEGVAVSYGETFDGATRVSLLAIVLVGAADVKEATRMLDRYRGLGLPTSVPDALEGALGALEMSVAVGEATVTRLYEFGDLSYFGCSFSVEVLA